MSDIVYCNREQAESILKKCFKKVIVTKITKSSERDMYFIDIVSIPGLYHSIGSIDLGKIITPIKSLVPAMENFWKGNRRYDLKADYDEELMKPINDACKKAIAEYEKGNDIFSSVFMKESRAWFDNFRYVTSLISKKFWLFIIGIIIACFLLCSCEYNDSIQNYEGGEIISISEIYNTRGDMFLFYSVQIRIKNSDSKNSSYQVISVQCIDAQGYQIGDTIKLRKFPK